jgi:hypothetical protein
MDYNARFYLPTVGRFVSGDVIVPIPFNPQSSSRYTYVLNNPMKYIDPSGHVMCIGEDCGLTYNPIAVKNLDIRLKPDLTRRGKLNQYGSPNAYGGEEVRALFELMAAEFNLSEDQFHGYLIMHEAWKAGANLEEQRALERLIATLVRNQLFIGGYRNPYCPTGPCENGAFNFWAAYSETAHRLIDKYVRNEKPISLYSGPPSHYGQEMTIDERLFNATLLGRSIHNPYLVSPGGPGNVPTEWGNYPEWSSALRESQISERQYVSTWHGSIVFYWDDFIVYTPSQSNHWGGVLGD